MSRLSKHAEGARKDDKIDAIVDSHASEAVVNYMGGTSYEMNPLDTLRIIAASSIFGEPQYYRAGGIANISTTLEYSIFGKLIGKHRSAAEVFTHSIDAALDYDFEGTLALAVDLRENYFMRLNPAVIFVRANKHPRRTDFNKSNPGYMRSVGKAIATRPDDITNQFEYFMFDNGSKKGLSSLMKRTWKDSLESYSRYQLNKYKGKKLIDLVRLSHANNKDIDELMKTGTLSMAASEQTWETLRSAGKSWMEILSILKVPHMALLRNLRGIFTEISDRKDALTVLTKLIDGVPYGKQFPFRYYSAYKAIQNGSVNHQAMILDALEDCMDKSVENMPKLEGRTMCLSDNSGSAWGTLNSEYGTTHVAEIANLSSLITSMQSDEGYVGVFGDRLSVKRTSDRKGLLKQTAEAGVRGKGQGGSTENGIWIFWRDAIENRTHYDNVFVYSDMQAGTGGLYGTNPGEYRLFAHKRNKRHIDVLALVEKYRQTVNSKVNVFMIQVAGYNNSLIPVEIYRGAILSSWTGKEPIYAKMLIDIWDDIETRFSRKNTVKTSHLPSKGKLYDFDKIHLKDSFSNLKKLI